MPIPPAAFSGALFARLKFAEACPPHSALFSFEPEQAQRLFSRELLGFALGAAFTSAYYVIVEPGLHRESTPVRQAGKSTTTYSKKHVALELDELLQL